MQMRVRFDVQGEMSMVVSCMRRNARWASAEQGKQDPLLQSFGALKQTLAGVNDLQDIEVDVFLGPFLDVVRSEVVGPITGVALSSINKFLSYGLIDMASPHAANGIESIADAVTHTKFMGTDLASDEVVLMKILQVLRTILLTPVGSCMSNEAVCELMQTCFKICFEMRLSELLRRCAEQTLTDMIHLLFSRLAVLDVPDQNDLANSPVKNKMRRTSDISNPPSAGDGGEGEAAEEVAGARAASGASEPGSPLAASASAESDADRPTSATPTAATAEPTPALAEAALQKVGSVESTNKLGVRFTPRENAADGAQVSYGIPCIRELFRFIISLINPRDRHNNETMIAMGLSLLTVAMETGGAHMSRFISLREYLEDDMCHNLFELLRTENLTLYAATLRVIFLTFEALRDPLKFQLERFLSIICETDYKTFSVEHKEGAMDVLLQLCRVPSFLFDLYLNFDCNLQCENLFAKVVAFLSQNAFPEDQQLMATHLNALDSLLTVVQEIANRESGSGKSSPPPIGVTEQKSPSMVELADIKLKKTLLGAAVAQFNEDGGASKALKMLSEANFMSTPPTHQEVAEFLRETPNLSKKEIGEFIGKRKNKAFVRPYVETFDVVNQPIDMALRQFLEAFRLPGEAPVISNILEDFANLWFETYSGEKVPRTADAAFILCYAIMQLNTDQHNPQVKDRMTFAQFVKNERKLNDNEDYPKEFLNGIFTLIRDTEIVMPSERKGAVKDEYEWKLVLSRARDPKRNCGVLKCNGAATYDEDMFSQVWKPTVTALCHVLDTTTDPLIVETILESLRKCAVVCARFELCETFDNLIIALCKRTLLTTQPPSEAESLEEPVPPTVPFVNDAKAHQVLALTFSLCHDHGSIMRHGWANIMDVMMNLFAAKLLPQEMTTVVGFVNDEWSLLPEEMNDQPKANDSWFGWLGGSSVGEVKPGEELDQRKLTVAREVVAGCKLQQIISESAFLQEASLTELFKSVMHLSRSPAAHATLGFQVDSYDEMASIFFLEQFYEVAMANKDRVSPMWDTLRDHLYGLALGAGDRARLAGRALVCLIKLGERLYRTDRFDQQVLDSFAIFEQLPAELKTNTTVRAQIVAGFAWFVKGNASVLSRAGWELFMKTLQGATEDQAANECAVDALQFVAESALTPENISICQATAVGYVDLAIDSALAAVQSGAALDDSIAPPEPLAAKVLTVLHTLHVAVPKVLGAGDGGTRLWTVHWEVILQAMSRFCTVAHRPIRQQALTLLQSCLMLPDLEQMSALEWKMCLEKVLFPLLSVLLEPPPNQASVVALEEIRIRANTLLSKVFLQHLTALVTLEDFVEMWLNMLGYLEKYMHAGSDLAEAVPQSLKNMLLVMTKDGILQPSGQATTPQKSGKPTFVNGLWSLTYTRLEEFLPGLFHEVLPGGPAPAAVAASPAPAAAPSAAAVSLASPPAAGLMVPPSAPGSAIPKFQAAPAFQMTTPMGMTLSPAPQAAALSPIVLGPMPSFSPAPSSSLSPNPSGGGGGMYSAIQGQPLQLDPSATMNSPLRMPGGYPPTFSTPVTSFPQTTPGQTPASQLGNPSTPAQPNAPLLLHSTPHMSNQ
jgi:brefeldin A-resistance guanine nucleotide exchange factor 1